MPYRPGIQSHGEDFVGETAALRKKLLRQIDHRYVDVFEDEDHFFWDTKQKELSNRAFNEANRDRMAYILFWGRVREGSLHPQHNNQCPECGICRCDRGRFRCFCGEGKKMLSPYRLAFKNTTIRKFWENYIYDVGRSVWVLKREKESPAPDWLQLNWK